MITAHWYELGRFRILAMPLPSNPAFTTHRIYLGERYIGAMLSVPDVQQCEDRLSEANRPTPLPASTWKGWSAKILKRRGRKPKAVVEQELLEALATG